MRKLPWSVLALVTAVAGLNVVFVGCGSEDSDGIVAGDDGGPDGTSSSSSTSSSSGGSSSSSSSSGSVGDGGGDGSLLDGQVCLLVGQTCSAASECCTKACLKAAGQTLGQCGASADGGGGACTAAGGDCTNSTECCTNSCVGGKCSATQCKADSPVAASCTTDAECCSGKCDVGGTGKCVAIAGGVCRTEGNPCTVNLDCCSGQCSGAGFCTNASYCAQLYDVCAADFECCSGNCVVPQGAAYGRCQALAAPGGNNCNPAGSICTGNGCDNKCCSLSCGPLGTTGVNVCQPPSGCRPQSEICATSGDCCGGPGQLTGQLSNGNPAPVKACIIQNGETYGRCESAQCLRPGDVCKAPTGACGGTSNNCCESLQPDGGLTPTGWCNSHPEECCSRDALGIPRCRGVNFKCTDAGVPAGSTCTTSADCCGSPCVGGKCQATCTAKGGECTISADCCSPEPCVVPTGSTKGICGGTIGSDGGVQPPPPDSGTTDSGTGDAATADAGKVCALYGQDCTVTSDCCSGVPCTSGKCRYP